MFPRTLQVTLIAVMILSGCAVIETSEATHILNGQTYAPVKAEDVVIYLEKPEFKYVLVGVVEARGMGITTEARDQELAIKALKQEAAKIGANGVILTHSTQQIAGVSKDGTSTERRIKGLAIRQ
jgi:hypothetical protein